MLCSAGTTISDESLGILKSNHGEFERFGRSNEITSFAPMLSVGEMLPAGGNNSSSVLANNESSNWSSSDVERAGSIGGEIEFGVGFGWPLRRFTLLVSTETDDERYLCEMVVENHRLFTHFGLMCHVSDEWNGNEQAGFTKVLHETIKERRMLELRIRFVFYECTNRLAVSYVRMIDKKKRSVRLCLALVERAGVATN